MWYLIRNKFKIEQRFYENEVQSTRTFSKIYPFCDMIKSVCHLKNKNWLRHDLKLCKITWSDYQSTNTFRYGTFKATLRSSQDESRSELAPREQKAWAYHQIITKVKRFVYLTWTTWNNWTWTLVEKIRKKYGRWKKRNRLPKFGTIIGSVTHSRMIRRIAQKHML